MWDQQSATRVGRYRRGAILVGVLGALLADSQTAQAQSKTAQTQAVGSGDAHRVRAEVVKPTQRPLTRTFRTPATLIADEQVDLYAKTSGYVSKIELNIGDRVSANQVLVELWVPEMTDEAAQAQAVLAARKAKVKALEAKTEQARRMIETAQAQVRRVTAQRELDAINFKRKEELCKGNAIPQQALDEARIALAVSDAQVSITEAQVAGAQAEQDAVAADVEVARAEAMVSEAELSRLRTLMEYASIRAPFAGVITVRYVDHGAFVRSAAEGDAVALLRVAKIDRIRVVLNIPEVDVPYVHAGTDVSIDVKALGGHPFPAKISRIAAALDPSTRSMRAEVDVDNAKGALQPGMYAQVEVTLETKAQATLIPSRAIRTAGKETVVFVVDGGVAKSMPVTLGYDDGTWVEILTGLTGSESIIISTNGAVAPGAAVQAFSSDS